jgi:hypothetical protein
LLRNKAAATIAIVSGVLFLISGYKANLALYHLIEKGISAYTGDFGRYAVIPIVILTMVAQLGGIAVIVGGILFAKNHITSGKVLVIIGTGQGIITVVLSLILGLVGQGLSYANSYFIWLASSATGLGIVFSIVARYVARGR